MNEGCGLVRVDAVQQTRRRAQQFRELERVLRVLNRVAIAQVVRRLRGLGIEPVWWREVDVGLADGRLAEDARGRILRYVLLVSIDAQGHLHATGLRFDLRDDAVVHPEVRDLGVGQDARRGRERSRDGVRLLEGVDPHDVLHGPQTHHTEHEHEEDEVDDRAPRHQQSGPGHRANQPYTCAKSLGMPFGTWYTNRSIQSTKVLTSARPRVSSSMMASTCFTWRSTCCR